MIAEVRKEVERALAKLTFFGFGVTSDVDWQNQMARVRILTSGHETNWLRIASSFASQGAGQVSPLAAGDEVLVCFPRGNPQGMGVVLARLYGANRAPEVAEQAWGVKRSSGYILLDEDGKVAASGTGLELESTTSAKLAAATTLELDGTLVQVGGTAGSAVKYEPLEVGLQAYAAAVQTQINALLALHSLPPVTIPISVVAAKSLKVMLG